MEAGLRFLPASWTIVITDDFPLPQISSGRNPIVTKLPNESVYFRGQIRNP